MHSYIQLARSDTKLQYNIIHITPVKQDVHIVPHLCMYSGG